ncbi:glycosyltransferase, partial [Rhodococcus sp. EPR-134]
MVVPVFNEENSLSNCIERLLIQSEIDEILVVDNNSTDSTASIIHKFAEKHDRVRYVFEARQGVVHARNAGFDASTGNIIGRIDADTRVQPGWARAVKGFFQRSTAHSAVAGLTYLFESPFARIHRFALDRQVKQGKFDCERQVLAVAGANMAIRKSAWLAVRERVSDRPDIHEDIDLSLCLRKEGMTIGQIADMRAETSGRRGETPPLEYLKYNQASESVLHLHNIMNWRLKLTIWGDSMLHALMWPVYRLYNFEQERLEF